MRALARIAGLALYAALFAALCAASLALHLQTPVALRAARAALSQLVSNELRGELAIGGVEALWIDRLVARHVALYDGEGRRIIVADRVALALDLSELGSGLLRIRHAQIDAATVKLIPLSDGSPSLLTTFDSERPATPAQGGAPGLRVIVDHIDVSRTTLYGELLGLRGLRVIDVEARGTLDVTQDVDVTIQHARGKIVAPFGFTGHLDALSGTLSSVDDRGIALQADVRRGHERARVTVAYRSTRPGTPEELDLRVAPSAISGDTLARLGFDFFAPVTAELSGDFSLRGPPDRLAMAAQAHSAAGDVAVTGEISEARGTTVHLTTERLDVATLVASAPEVIARGSADVVVAGATAAPRVRLSLGALRYKGFDVPAFELEGVIEQGGLRVERAHTQRRGGRLELRGVIGATGDTDLVIDAAFPALEREPNLAARLPDARGGLTAQLRLRTSKKGAGALAIRGRVVLHDFAYGSITASRITLTGSATGDPELPNLSIQVLGEDVAVLAYALGDAKLAIRGGPRGYRAQGEFAARGQKTFYVDSTISADRSGFVVQADPIEFSVGENTWRGLARDLTVKHRRSVSLGLLRLGSRSQRLEASGIVRVDGEDEITAQLQDFDLAAVHALLGSRFPLAQGHADATVEIHGDVARPELLVQGALRGGRLWDVDGVDALYFVTYKDGRLELDSEVSAASSVVRAGGHATLDETIGDPAEALLRGRYQLDVSSSELDLTLVPALRPLLVAGRASGEAHLQGTLEAPTFTSTLALMALTLPGARPVDVQGELGWDGKQLRCAMKAGDARGELGHAQGTLDLAWAALRDDPAALLAALTRGRFALSGATAERALDALPVDLPAELQLPVVVSTRFDLARRGGPTEGFVRFTLAPKERLPDELCELQVRPELRGMLVLQAGQTRFSYTGHVDGARVASGEGALGLQLDAWLAGEPAHGDGTIDVRGRVDIPALQRIPWLCRHGRGELQGTFDVRSLLGASPRAKLTLRSRFQPGVPVTRGQRKRPADVCRDQPVELALSANGAPGNFAVTGEMRGCRGGPLRVHAFLPVRWGGAQTLPALADDRDLRVQLDMERAELRPLLDRIPAVSMFSAKASGRLVVRGKRDRVHYHGDVEIADGKLYTDNGQRLRDLTARLHGNGTWVKLERFSAKAGNGTVLAQGGLGFDLWSPRRVQAAVQLRSFPVQREGVDLAWLTGSAAVESDIGPERALTAVKIHTLSARLPDASNRSLQPLEDHPDLTLTTQHDKPHPEIPYALEFFVNGRRPIDVRRNDFSAVIGTELAMSYREPELRVGGYVDFRRGNFEVFGKDFELTRGSMHFDGSTQMNPDLHLVATHEPAGAGGSPIVVTVTGTLERPEIAFSSESCPGDGAVVQLVSGRCPSDDPAAAGDASGAQDAFAAGIVGGIVTLGAKRELSGLAPRFSVESTGQGAQARLKAGFEAVPKFMRRLVQRIYVQGAVSTSEQATWEQPTADDDATLDFLIELYFPHNIVGSGHFAQTNWGLDVTWEP